MKLDLTIRARTCQGISIATRHEQWMAGLGQWQSPWGLAGREVPATPSPGSQLSITRSLKKYLGPPLLRAGVTYTFRPEERFLTDEARWDDFVDFTYNAAKMSAESFRYLASYLLPTYATAFGAYRAHLGDEEFIYLDYERAKTDGRSGITRVHMSNCWDGLLCNKAFGKAPSEIVSRLQGVAEAVSLWRDGVFVLMTSTLVDTAEQQRMHEAAMKALQA